MTGTTRFEIVPLEALRVGPGEVLVIRVPGKRTAAELDEIHATLKPLGLDGRVLLVAAEIDLAVVESRSRNSDSEAVQTIKSEERA